MGYNMLTMQNDFLRGFKKNFPLFTSPTSKMIVVISAFLVIIISGGIFLLATKTNVNGSKANEPTSQLSPFGNINQSPTAQSQSGGPSPIEIQDGPDSAPSVSPTPVALPTPSPTNVPSSNSTGTPTPTTNITSTPTPTSTSTPTPTP